MFDLSHAMMRGFDGPETETIGHTYHGTAGDNTRTGTGRDDTFNFGQGGEDTLNGAGGNDIFNMKDAFDAGDSIDGGDGNDVLNLDGYYGSTFVVVTPDTFTSVETITFAAGNSYQLDMGAGTVPAGARLTVDATALGSSALSFEVEFGNNGRFIVKGGAGGDLLEGGGNSDTITGGNGSDQIDGADGADKLTSGAGNDEFFYREVSNSTGKGFDTITGFNTDHDKFIMGNDITGVNNEVIGGGLDSGSFNADLHAAIGSHQLGKHHAVLFAPDSGDHHGEIFLIIDANNQAGYQANKDYVIELDAATHLDNFGISNFPAPG